MITLPPKVARGDEVTASWANRVIDCLSSLRPMAGAGTRVSQTPGGFMVSTLDQATAIFLKPFDISEQISAIGERKLTLWPGLVNGILASNIYDSFAVDATHLWYIKAACTSDGTQITAATIVVDTSAPDIQTPATDAMPSEVDVLVGLYKERNSYNIAQGNVTLTPSTVSTADGHYSGVWIPS